MNTTTFAGIQEVIKFKMEVMADMIGATPKSITRITGWGNDTQAYENLRLVLNTVKMGNLTMDELNDILYSLNKIQEELEKAGF